MRSGSADLSGDAQALLLEIGSILAGIGNQVLVEGHTDDIPIHTARFASNWELSTTRATNVIAFLLDRAKVSPDHVSAAGYAEHHPKVANTSDANRTRNRRVDLIILNPTRGVAEPAGAAAAAHPLERRFRLHVARAGLVESLSGVAGDSKRRNASTSRPRSPELHSTCAALREGTSGGAHRPVKRSMATLACSLDAASPAAHHDTPHDGNDWPSMRWPETSRLHRSGASMLGFVTS